VDMIVISQSLGKNGMELTRMFVIDLYLAQSLDLQEYLRSRELNGF
jgi:hypothetical protein